MIVGACWQRGGGEIDRVPLLSRGADRRAGGSVSERGLEFNGVHGGRMP